MQIRTAHLFSVVANLALLTGHPCRAEPPLGLHQQLLKEPVAVLAKAAREHVLRHHTPQALAHHIVSTTLAAGQRGPMA